VVDPVPGLEIVGGPRAYRQFVREGMGEGHQADYYAVADQRFLGTERFVEQWQDRIEEAPRSRPHQDLSRALKAVAAGLGTDVAQLRSADRSWAVSRQRTLAAYVLIRRWGFRACEVAAALARDPATLSVLLTRYTARLRKEPAMQRDLDRLAKTIKI
jgi:chromosomal replication initiation ATPase DnaA